VRLPAEWFKAPLDRREGALRGIGWDLDLGADLKPRSELVYATGGGWRIVRPRLSRCDPSGCVVCLRQYLWHRIGSLGNRKYGVRYICVG
jgi:hypothetical protein